MELQLKRIMREKGIDGKQLGDMMGVSKQHICNVVNGRAASIRMYEKMADLLGVPLWALFAPPTVKETQNVTPDLTMTPPQARHVTTSAYSRPQATKAPRRNDYPPHSIESHTAQMCGSCCLPSAFSLYPH